MNISQEIESAFLCELKESVLTDEFIQNNFNPLELNESISSMAFVPAYMLWCLKHGEKKGNLVCDYTINCLAEFGRAKHSGNSYLNFKSQCNEIQKSAIVSFLNWALSTLEFCNKQQIVRSIKHWQ